VLFFAAAGAASTSARTAQPPTNLATPVITGKAQEGQILRAHVGRSRRSHNAAFSYQWRRCDSAGGACVDIAKASDRVYTLRHGDVGHTLRVVVTAKGSGGSASASSAATPLVGSAPVDAPLNDVAPTLTGDAVHGGVLTAEAGTWTGKQPIRIKYRWRRCDEEGGSCQNLGREGQTYTLRDRDVEHAFRVLVIARNAVETGAALSDPTPAVTEPTPPRATAPTNTSPPVVTGTAEQGKTLTASSGAWTGTTPILFSYSWLRCDRKGGSCATTSSASAQAHTLTPADVGHTMRVRVSATNSAGSGSAVSAQTPIVVAVNAPVNASLPALSGTARRGETLTASSGSWKGTEPIEFSYRWLRCNAAGANCSPISGARTQKYTLTSDDVAHTLRVEITATNRAGSTAALSNASAMVVASGTSPASTARPSISGNAQQGQTLTVSNGSWNGTPPIRFSYAWERCDANGNNCATIAGATSNHYSLSATDVAHRVRGRVTASNAFGSGTSFSSPSDLVRGPPLLASPPTIAGEAVDGSALTASSGNWTSVSGLAFTYQWARCDAQGQNCTPITGAGPSIRSYTLTTADVGHRLIVQVKAINQSGASFANSTPTAVIAAKRAPRAQTSRTISVGSVSLPDRLIVDRVQFVPTRIRSRARPLTLRVHVSEVANGRPVSGALVLGLGVPFNRLSAEREVATGPDGWATISFRVLPTFALRRGNFVVVFVRARKPGENVLAGVSTRRLVSVRIG
jgi:hypothetical protein